MEKRYCEICGKEITNSNRKYCSVECRDEANRIRSRGGVAEIPLKELRCPVCGKTFKQTRSRQKYCSPECLKIYQREDNYIRNFVYRIAEKFDFNVINLEKIARAKKMLFTRDKLRRCPCDAKNPDRYCGSALCIHDVVHHGHCHCNMFCLRAGKKSIEELDRESKQGDN